MPAVIRVRIAHAEHVPIERVHRRKLCGVDRHVAQSQYLRRLRLGAHGFDRARTPRTKVRLERRARGGHGMFFRAEHDLDPVAVGIRNRDDVTAAGRVALAYLRRAVPRQHVQIRDGPGLECESDGTGDAEFGYVHECVGPPPAHVKQRRGSVHALQTEVAEELLHEAEVRRTEAHRFDVGDRDDRSAFIHGRLAGDCAWMPGVTAGHIAGRYFGRRRGSEWRPAPPPSPRGFPFVRPAFPRARRAAIRRAPWGRDPRDR